MHFMQLALAFLTALTLSVATNAKPEELSSTDTQASTTLAILDMLGTNHYQAPAIDDALSAEFLDNYLEQLDPAKSYFLASDITRFARYKTQLDDLIKQGNVKPAFEIFNVYRQRVTERLKSNINLLKKPQPFDFNNDEYLEIDPDKLQWQTSSAALDDLWRKRVKDSYLRLLLADKEEDKIPELLIKRYKNQLKRIEDMDSEDVYQSYMNAFTTLYDPHTNYFSPRQLENFNISMSLSLEGIGAVLQTEDENTQVVRVVPGGPADQQGELAPEDIIVGVGQGDDEIQDVVGWRLDDVVDLIRGEKGSTVRLEIIPAKGEQAGVNKVISIVRDQVKLEEQAAKSRVIDISNNSRSYKLGVITIPAFYLDFEAYRNRDPNYKSTTRDVARLLDNLRAAKVDGIILDLRNNGGGSLQEATTLTDLFIEPGPVVQIRQTNQMISRQYRSREAPLYDGPLVVLINRLSASASEIFAGALQDYGRAVVVGSQSFGKGTVQSLVPLPEGQLKLTESKFYRVSGDSTQHRGVVPDIEFPSVYNIEDIGESSEEHALPWDKIHGIPVARHMDVDKLVPILSSQHQSRAANDPDYNFLLNELAYRESRRDETALSLNLEKRKAQRNEGEQAFFKFENERRQQKGLPPYASIEEWKKTEAIADDEDETTPSTETEEIPLEDDPFLKEAGMILSDQIQLTTTPGARLVDAGK